MSYHDSSTKLPWPKCLFFLPYASKTLHLRLGQVQRTSDEMQNPEQQNRKHSSVHRLACTNNIEASCLLVGGYPHITRSSPTLPPRHTATDQRRPPKPLPLSDGRPKEYLKNAKSAASPLSVCIIGGKRDVGKKGESRDTFRFVA